METAKFSSISVIDLETSSTVITITSQDFKTMNRNWVKFSEVQKEIPFSELDTEYFFVFKISADCRRSNDVTCFEIPEKANLNLGLVEHIYFNPMTGRWQSRDVIFMKFRTQFTRKFEYFGSHLSPCYPQRHVARNITKLSNLDLGTCAGLPNLESPQLIYHCLFMCFGRHLVLFLIKGLSRACNEEFRNSGMTNEASKWMRTSHGSSIPYKEISIFTNENFEKIQSKSQNDAELYLEPPPMLK